MAATERRGVDQRAPRGDPRRRRRWAARARRRGLEPRAGVAQGAAAIPVSVVGPLVVELGAYELEEPAGTLRETGRAQEELLVPLAHTEGGLSASMSRG